MASEGIAKRYALALFQVAEEKGDCWQYVKELNGVEKALEVYPELKSALWSPMVDDGVKKSILKQLFVERVSPPVLNFLFLLIDKGRFELFAGMAAAFVKLCLEASGEMEAMVESALPLPEELQTALAEALSKKKGKQVKLKTRVNPDLLGGLVVTMGDQMIDMSLKGRLKEIQENLK